MKALFFFVCALAVVPVSVFSGDAYWDATLVIPKTSWLPGEPISVVVKVVNTSNRESKFSWGSFFLDNNEKPCVDRNAGVVDGPEIPPGGTAEEIVVLDKPGTIHTNEVNIGRACNMEISNRKMIGIHEVCYAEPQSGQKACAEFEIIEPKGLDLEIYLKFPGDLRDVLSDATPQLRNELLENYRTSNYAAHLLWAQGHAWYDQVPASEPEEDLLNDPKMVELLKNSIGPLRGLRENLNKVIEPWEELRRNFPDFVYRPDLLYGLTRVYCRLNESPKAVPLLKELLERHPQSEPAKKGKAYKDVLLTHNVWKE